MFGEQSSAERPPRGHDQSSGTIRFLDQALWRRLAEATAREDYLAAWLALQCSMLDGARRAVLVLRDVESNALAACAYWPEAVAVPAELVSAIEEAVAKRQGIARHASDNDGSSNRWVALPLLDGSEVWGAVGVEIERAAHQDISLVMRRLQWGGAWIDALLWRDRMERTSRDNERIQAAIDMIASALDEASFRGACQALAGELARRLSCDRVSVGFLHGSRVRIEALSHSAHFDRRMKVMTDLSRAMDEAIDQGQAITVPAPESQIAATRAHRELLRHGDAKHVLTVPLAVGGVPVGAMLLERGADAAFDQPTVELCATVALAVGPVLDARRRDDRLLIAKAWDSLVHWTGAALGPDYLGRKLLVLLAVALVAYLWLAQGDFRVTADAVLEGAVERQLVAPFDGYLATVDSRPGDKVAAGTVLATLDDRDFVLERLRWQAERQQRQMEAEQALAEGDRAALNLLLSQKERAEVEIELVDELIRRSRLVAPFDAYVAKGDLSRSVGSSVQRGQTLLELAPLDDYRVILLVDERDVAYVAPGQLGMLAISAVPDRPIPFLVERMTAVSEPGDGRNRFRIEGRLTELDDVARLRPGLSGIGKIDVDHRPLLWIWTYKIVDWIRLRVWRWWT